LAWVVSTPTPYKERFFESLAARAEIDPHVMYLSWSDPQRPWKLEKTRSYEFTALSGFGIRSSLKRKSFWRFNFSVFGALRRHQSDVVVICGYNHPTLWFALLHCFFTGTPFFLQGESHTRKERGTLKQLIKRCFLFPILRRCVGAFATGQGAAEYWESVGIAKNRIFTVANTPDVEAITRQLAASDPNLAVERSEFAQGDQRLGIFVGRLDRVKGLDVLLRALLRVDSRHRPAILIVGDGPQRRELQAEIDEHQLSVSIVEFKQPHELPAFYALADFFILPSRHEPWGVVVNEAMACGLPVVLSDQVGAAYDLLKEGINGFLFPSECVEALAETLDKLGRMSSAELKNMGQKSSTIIKPWTPEASAENVVAALLKCVSTNAE